MIAFAFKYMVNIQLGKFLHGVQRRMSLVDNFFVFLRLFFAVLLLYVT